MNFGNIVIMMSKLAQSRETLHSGDNIALAYTTKYFVSGNKYIGQMSDSKLITICVKDGNNNMNVDFINEIITAWPNN